MNTSDNIVATKDQLNRTLGFFPRVDTKASVILAVDTSMLAFLASKASPYTPLRWEWIPIAAAVVLLGVSLWHLYREAFPQLDGGQQSLMYFREVAKRTEVKYLTEWKQLTDAQYLDDLLGQVWRNSEILKQKFNHVRVAFNCLALAITPWLIAIAWLSWKATPIK